MDEHYRAGLRPWIQEARKRPKVVDPDWLEELARIYVREQLLWERFQRYVIGSGLDIFSPAYRMDPVVRRHEERVTRRRDNIRMHIADLIVDLRTAMTLRRTSPCRGHRTRREWWRSDPVKSPEKPSAARKPVTKKPRKPRKPSKLYSSRRVRSLVEEARRRERRGSA